MSDKYINQTGLSYYHGRIKNIFASQTALQSLSDEVDQIIAEGGEPNVIEEVQRNGMALPVTSKAVNINVPTATSDLTNDGDGNSNYATEDYVSQHGGKIDKIKVNGTEQTITNKEVDISIPTKTSDLTNDSDFQNATQVQTAIDSAVSSAYKYKGSVANYESLPSSGQKSGDVYDVQDTGMNYAWNGTTWDALGTYVDTSLLWAKSELVAMTTAEIDAILNA